MKIGKPLNSLFKGWLQKISSTRLLITSVMQVVVAQQVQKPNEKDSELKYNNTTIQ